MSSIVNYYELLEVIPTASERVINYAYKGKFKQLNTSLNKDNKVEVTRLLQLLNEAKEVLTNSSKRKAYDKKLDAINPNKSNWQTSREKKLLDEMLKAAEKVKNEIDRDAVKAKLEKEKAEQLRKEAKEIKKNAERESRRERAVKAENLEQALKAKYAMKMSSQQLSRVSYKVTLGRKVLTVAIALMFIALMFSSFSASIFLTFVSVAVIKKGMYLKALILSLFVVLLFKLARYSFGQFKTRTFA